jgi:hypothetical protein
MTDEVIPVWRKASYSDGYGACVEIAVLPDGTIGVRDSKNPGGPKFVFTRSAWVAFLTEAKLSYLDL